MRLNREKIPLTLLKAIILIAPFQLYFALFKQTYLSVAQVLVLLLVIYTLIFKHKELFELLKRDKTGLGILLFIATMFVSAAFAGDKFLAIKHVFKRSVYLFLYFPLVLSVDLKEKVKNLSVFFLIPALILVLIGILQTNVASNDMVKFVRSNEKMFSIVMHPKSLSELAPHGDFNWYQKEGGKARVFGTFINTNNLAQYAGLMLPLFIVFALILPGKKRKTLFFMVALGLVFLNVMSGSRGGILGMLAAILVGIICSVRKSPFKKLVFFLVFGAVLAAFTSFLVPRVYQDRFKSEHIEDSLEVRKGLWAGGLDIFKRNFLLGAGPANYMNQLDLSISKSVAHNNFIQTAAETGIFGIGFLLFIIGTLIKKSFSLLSSDDSLFFIFGAAFLAIWTWFVFQSMFSSYLYGDKFGMIFWIIAGLNTAIYNLGLRDGIEKKNI